MEFVHDFWNSYKLLKPDLICLRQDHLLYKISLLQVNGKIDYDTNGIRYADKSDGYRKFNAFIDKSIVENIDLAITPEYSCPWDLITDTLNNGKFPLSHKIWVIGCQSIKPREIISVIKDTPEILWIYDNDLVNDNLNENKFFDPVCFFLRTFDSLGKEQKIGILQFKTFGFGGNDFEWERDNSIPGRRIYIIENLISSTKLVTLICSDTLQQPNFNEINNHYFSNVPLLLIHIQLNQKPQNINYKSYRNQIFSKGNADDQREIICLNWARKVTYDYDGAEHVFNKYGGSGFYLKSSKIDVSDKRINLNHSKGLYYTYWKEMKSHLYLLNYEEYLFIIESTKPSQYNSDPSQYKRTGPEIKKVLKWQNDTWNEEETVSDGFAEFCSEIEATNGDLNCLKNENHINNERIINLSCGEIIFEDDWHNIQKLKTCQIDNSEISNRNLFTQEPDLDSQQSRFLRVIKYSLIKHSFLNNPAKVPKIFINGKLGYDSKNESKYKHLLNLQAINSEVKGTGIYLGDTIKARAEDVKNKIQMFFRDTQQGKQVIVWFNNGNKIECLSDENKKPEVGENTSKSNNSITRKGKK